MMAVLATILIISGETVQEFLETSPFLSPHGQYLVRTLRGWGIGGVAAALFALVGVGTLLGLLLVRGFIRVRMPGRRRAILIGMAIFIIGAFATDRVALAVWRWRLEHYCEKLCREFALGPSKSEIIGFGPGRPGDGGRVPLVEIRLLGPRPWDITVDGNGGLNLLYTPPWLAWSRYLPYLNPRRMVARGSDMFPFNDVFILRIQTVEERRDGRDLPVPKVTLEHGLPTE
jgi:MFS family permease